jgi:hypothetical protein
MTIPTTSTQNKDSSIRNFVTIDLARQKLGERGKKMTDKEINDLLVMLRFICNKAIDGVIEGKINYAN